MKTEAELRTALAAAEEEFHAKLDEAARAEQAFRWAREVKDAALRDLMRHLEARIGMEDLEVVVGRRAGKNLEARTSGGNFEAQDQDDLEDRWR